jgi:hypothetical protein
MEKWAAHFWAGGKGGAELTNHRPEAEEIKEAAQILLFYTFLNAMNLTEEV